MFTELDNWRTEARNVLKQFYTAQLKRSGKTELRRQLIMLEFTLNGLLRALDAEIPRRSQVGSDDGEQAEADGADADDE